MQLIDFLYKNGVISDFMREAGMTISDIKNLQPHSAAIQQAFLWKDSERGVEFWQDLSAEWSDIFDHSSAPSHRIKHEF